MKEEKSKTLLKACFISIILIPLTSIFVSLAYKYVGPAPTISLVAVYAGFAFWLHIFQYRESILDVVHQILEEKCDDCKTEGLEDKFMDNADKHYEVVEIHDPDNFVYTH